MLILAQLTQMAVETQLGLSAQKQVAMRAARLDFKQIKAILKTPAVAPR